MVGIITAAVCLTAYYILYHLSGKRDDQIMEMFKTIKEYFLSLTENYKILFRWSDEMEENISERAKEIGELQTRFQNLDNEEAFKNLHKRILELESELPREPKTP